MRGKVTYAWAFLSILISGASLRYTFLIQNRLLINASFPKSSNWTLPRTDFKGRTKRELELLLTDRGLESYPKQAKSYSWDLKLRVSSLNMNGTKVPKTSKILIANCNFFGANNNDNDQSHLPDALITWDEVCIQKMRWKSKN